MSTFDKNDVTRSSMDPGTAAGIVGAARARSLRLMAEREAEIKAGVDHVTPAEQMKRGDWKP